MQGPCKGLTLVFISPLFYAKCMPTKNSVRTFIENGYYHIYNRGVAKQKIFTAEKDYRTFLYFIKEYLLPIEQKDSAGSEITNARRKPISCSADIELLAYCLMPNHFHFLIKNTSEKGMAKFMKALSVSYSGYFNRTYQRVGPIFQGRYKAVLIETNEQLVYVSKYVHRNPKNLLARVRPLQEYSYSSYVNYLGKRKQDWVKPKEILSFFSNNFYQSDYKSFVEEYEENSNNFLKNISRLLLGEDDD